MERVSEMGNRQILAESFTRGASGNQAARHAFLRPYCRAIVLRTGGERTDEKRKECRTNSRKTSSIGYSYLAILKNRSTVADRNIT